jgi:hypothetical protein
MIARVRNEKRIDLPEHAIGNGCGMPVSADRDRSREADRYAEEGEYDHRKQDSSFQGFIAWPDYAVSDRQTVM